MFFVFLTRSFHRSPLVEREREKESCAKNEASDFDLAKNILKSSQVGFLSVQSLQPQATRTIPLDTLRKI